MNSFLKLLLWLAVLAGASAWLALNLRPAADLTAFLPADSKGNAALLDELRDGATTRLILIALHGEEAKTLARLSKQWVNALEAEPSLRRIDNGQRQGGEQLLELARQYRYQLTANDLNQRLSEAGLRKALQARLRDLSSAMEMAVKDLLPADPTHETLAVLESWRPAHEPQRLHGVWFDAAGERALLVAETVAPGFDMDGQAAAVRALKKAFVALEPGSAEMLLTGPGPFAVMLRETTQSEAQLFSTLAVFALLGILLLVYRHWPLLLYGGLPLASGVVAALIAVEWVYGGIHGITLAFGATLLGVAIDYPLHLFSHHHQTEDGAASMRRIWPTLRLGVLSTCIAYLSLVFSDFTGLAQLGLFTVVGLLVAAACTRWLLPSMLGPAHSDPAQGYSQRWLRALQSARLPAMSLGLLLAVSIAVLLWRQDRLWQNDLSALTPVPVELQQADAVLRQELGAAELRHILVIEAPQLETVLQASEHAESRLRELVARGELGGFDQPARYLPSMASQQQRRQALPEDAALAASLAQASEALPFRSRLFAPFLEEVAAARQAPQLDAQIYAGTAIEARLNSLLKRSAEGWRALIPLQAVKAPSVLEQALADLPHGQLVDLKQASEAMVIGFRAEALWRIALAGLIIVLLAVWGLAGWQWLNVVLPVVTTVLAEAALFSLMGLPLSLFHLISLMLVGGIVLDYALFFNRQNEDLAERVRTLHALSVCAVSTLTVFGILALSEIPVLRAIGVTVASGVLMGYTLTALTAKGDVRTQPDEHATIKTQ